MCESYEEGRSFLLHIRCAGCLELSSRFIGVGGAEDAPRDADELVDSGLLNSLTYQCSRCDGIIGHLVSVKTVGRLSAA